MKAELSVTMTVKSEIRLGVQIPESRSRGLGIDLRTFVQLLVENDTDHN
jgi:hypothetical protein